jgi:hypothetical protein
LNFINIHKPNTRVIPVFELQIYINILFNNKIMLYLESEIRTLFLLFLSLSLLIPMYGFSGDGSLAEPYQISTCTQLQNMSSNLGANYLLNNSIDCSGIANFKPIGYCVGSCGGGEDSPFTGNFNGNYSTISNLAIVNLSSSGNDGWGLFGYIDTSINSSCESEAIITSISFVEAFAL